MKDILTLATSLESKIIEDRRYLHKNPEIGFDLPDTAAYVKKQLDAMEIEYRDCGGKLDPAVTQKYEGAGFGHMERSTGVLATIGKGRPCILLRADMDALPIQETPGLVDFAASNGAGHMCGHDSHAAMLLGAAKILKEKESELAGTVKLMFQPGEELGYGSKTMVDDGATEGVDAAFAIHVMADQPVGKVGFTRGVTSASMDTYMIKIQGRGGHSSKPHTAIDPIMIANQLYTTLNLLSCREIDPSETVALTAGKMAGGTAANIIPDTATLQVGVRTYNIGVREHLAKRIPEIIDHTVKMWRGSYDLIQFATPSTFTDTNFIDELLPFISEIVGEENLSENPKPMSGTEDFSYVSAEVPSMFATLGAGSPDAYPMHNPNMYLDESVFKLGAGMYANCAIEWLNKHRK